MSDMRRLKHLRSARPRSFRTVILISFSTVAIVMMTMFGFVTMSLISRSTRTTLQEATQSTVFQGTLNIENYLSSIRSTSNAIYYDVIKKSDLSTDSISDNMQLLYAANSNQIVSIALFHEDGTLICEAPDAVMKPNVDVREQEWFTSALAKVENIHFSQPHIQNLFVSPSHTYQWVITLSTAVDLTQNGKAERGVLLIDMNYQAMEQLLEETNTELSGSYLYLMANDGTLIYHPYQSRIQAGQFTEATETALHYQDGAHSEINEDGEQIVIVQTVSYTGWKLVGVIPRSILSFNERETRSLIVMIVSLTALALVIINRALARQVSDPLIRLNDAIANMEGVNNLPPQLYENSSAEIQELGATLHSYMAQINRLMDEMRKEEEEKRKSELDALQAQINPHFLYNTLDSIVWMIEDEKYKEAVFMITQLASFFRMSLNRGHSIIRIDNELKQAEAYLNIQRVRYKQSFTAQFDIEDNIGSCLIVKLVLQPILENAIYHGIKEAEQDGLIRIHGYRSDDDIYIDVSDNGYGMTPEEVENILIETKRPAVEKHGSGVGLINVDRRLRLRFGDSYGLSVKSELDVGTTVTIHIPAIEATEENMTKYEGGTR